MGRRINTIMQTCFFAISGVLPREQAIDEIKKPSEDLRQAGRGGRAQELRRRGPRSGPSSTRWKSRKVTSTFECPRRPAEAPDFVQT
jgi:pyruvate-ferredoxin/flavodoxin oxidoreductase